MYFRNTYLVAARSLAALVAMIMQPPQPYSRLSERRAQESKRRKGCCGLPAILEARAAPTTVGVGNLAGANASAFCRPAATSPPGRFVT